jgi:hypothetical protein
MNTLRRSLILLLALLPATALAESSEDAWQANWESLSKHEVPQWARDAKFGIYAHWGVYSVSGGWERTTPNWGNYYILPYRGIYDLTGKDETFGLFEKNVGPVFSKRTWARSAKAMATRISRSSSSRSTLTRTNGRT